MPTIEALIAKNNRDIAMFRLHLARLTHQQENCQTMSARRLAMLAIAALNARIAKAEESSEIRRSKMATVELEACPRLRPKRYGTNDE
jgi:hypothetical protein